MMKSVDCLCLRQLRSGCFAGTLAVFVFGSGLLLSPEARSEWGCVGGLSESPSLAVNPTSMDADGDGMPDTWEDSKLLNKNFPEDARSDFDRDGLAALQEYLLSLATSGQYGEHLGKWSATAIPCPAGFAATPSVTLVECASNGIILARVQGALVGSTTTSYPYTYSPMTGAWTRIAVPNGYSSARSLTPLDVNDAGQVVGYFSSSGTKGFVFTPNASGGQTSVFQLGTTGGPVHAVPKKISNTGFVVGTVGTLSGRGFAGDEDGDELILTGLGSNPVYHDVNDYGEFIGTTFDPIAGRQVTFLAVPGQSVFSSGIGSEVLDEMAGIWGVVPDIDPAEIVWDGTVAEGYRLGTVRDQRTGATIGVSEGYGAGFYWYHQDDSGGAWYSYPGFSQSIASVNDWGGVCRAVLR